MDIFVQATVFNGRLAGNAVFIEGYDVDGGKWEGNYLVKCVEGEYITLVNPHGNTFPLHMENFEGEDGIKITVLTKGAKE